MLSLQEAMQLDFTGGLTDMDIWFGSFGPDNTVSEAGTSPVNVLTDKDIWFGSFGPDNTVSEAGTSPVNVPNAGDNGGEEEAEEEGWRRLRRKISNRESARRSRARKQKRMEELERAAEALRAENRALAARLGAAARRILAVRRRNARLLDEAGALRCRLGEAQSNAAVLLGMSRLLRMANHGGGLKGTDCAASAGRWRGIVDDLAS